MGEGRGGEDQGCGKAMFTRSMEEGSFGRWEVGFGRIGWVVGLVAGMMLSLCGAFLEEWIEVPIGSGCGDSSSTAHVTMRFIPRGSFSVARHSTLSWFLDSVPNCQQFAPQSPVPY